jgi:hypothetical protein
LYFRKQLKINNLHTLSQNTGVCPNRAKTGVGSSKTRLRLHDDV